MAHLLLGVLPLALGAAVSPTLLMVEVLALSTGRSPVKKGWAVAAGSATALAAITAAGLALGRAAAHRHPHHAIDAGIDALAAALLAWLVVHQLRLRDEPAKGPSMLERLGETSASSFFMAGLVMMLTNFSTLILLLPALRVITRSPVDLAGQGLALGMLLVIALLPVLAPVGLVSLLGRRARPALASLNSFASSHSLAISVSLELVFCAYFLVKLALELLAT
jgi:hypothetical protein